MRKITIFLTVLIAISITTTAQIPNSGFEVWTTTGSYAEPTSWATMNPACSGPFYSATKSTDHFPTSVGNYSIRVESNTSLTQYTGGFGMAITNAFDYPFKPAFPIVNSPTSLCGYYKYIPINNDSMFIRIVFFKNSILLGYNTFVTGISTSNWTSFILPLTYPTADSATLYISALWFTTQTSGPKGNSVLYVDNLSFDNLISSIPEQTMKNDLVIMYPNPASDIVTFNINYANNSELTLNIYNVIGTLVKSETLKQNTQQLNIGDLSCGVYMVSIKTKDSIENRKLIIRR